MVGFNDVEESDYFRPPLTAGLPHADRGPDGGRVLADAERRHPDREVGPRSHAAQGEAARAPALSRYEKYCPPLTSTTAPVTKPAASLASQLAAAATSDGLPALPTGMEATVAAFESLVVKVSCTGVKAPRVPRWSAREMPKRGGSAGGARND